MTTALVTGASSGIGAAAVRAFAKDGVRVIATARREDRLRTLAEETGCEYLVADLLADGVDVIGRYLAAHARWTCLSTMLGERSAPIRWPRAISTSGSACTSSTCWRASRSPSWCCPT